MRGQAPSQADSASIPLFIRFKLWLCRYLRSPQDDNSENAGRNLELLKRNRGLLLDCGCGGGQNLVELESSLPGQYRLLGLDVFWPDVQAARTKVSPAVALLCADALNIPIADGVFDAVLSNQVIEHIRRYERYLSEIARILRPGGLLALSTPNFHCPRNMILKLLAQKPVLRWPNTHNEPPEKFRGHIQEFTERELVPLVERHGFVLVKSLPIVPRPTLEGNWAFNLYRAAEYAFYVLSRPFAGPGYSKNNTMLFRRSAC